MLIHIKTFVECLSSGGASGEKAEDAEKLSPGSWTPSTNLVRMCMYFPESSEGHQSLGTETFNTATGSYVSFDIMAELVSGKAFHLLDNSNNRFIIDLI